MNTQDWRRLNELADRLEQAWEKKDDVDLGQFLPPSGDPLRGDVLRELITTDLEIRWRRKQGRPLEFYTALYPELGPVAALPPKLIYEEYRVRCRHGDHPELPLYQERFPEQFPHLQKMLQQDPVATLRSSVSTPSAPPAPPGPVKPLDNTHVLMIGGYALEKLIGRGGFGEVWRATAPGGFPAAVKIIARPADHEERIREERALEVIKQLNHHFLIRTIASWAEQDRLYIAMDLADSSLRERLKQCKTANQGGLPLDELLRYFRQSAEALDYLHEHDVLHRDIKPDNILLVGGYVRLADFGLARHQEQILASVSGAAGTPAYMAPEVWRGKASKHSDQYSLAYTYAELRLGHRAFASTDYAGIMFDHLDNTPNLEPLPESEKTVLLKALAKKPDERYPTCLAFIEALEDVYGVMPRGSRPVPTIGRAVNQTLPKLHDLPVTQAHAGATARRPDDVPSIPQTEAFRSLLPHQHDQLNNVTGPLPKARKEAAKGRRRRVLPFAAVGLLFVAVVAGFVALLVYGARPPDKTPSPASLILTVPASVKLHPGEQQSVVIHVTRRNMTGPIELRFETPLPVTLESAAIPADEDAVTVVLVVAAGAEKGEGPIHVYAAGDQVTAHEQFTASVEVAGAPPWVPEHYQPAANARPLPPDFRNRVYYDRLVANWPDLPPVTFVLIPQQRDADLPPYYLMESKVSNALTAALAKKSGVAVAWPTDGDKADLPAFGMTAEEADRMARVLDGLLPTTKQWDKAAGLESAERPSPFVGGPSAAVNRWKEGPRSVKERGDVSLYGICDLAGNGMEFTRDLLGGKMVPWKDAPEGTLVILRGRLYTALRPLSFADLAEQQTTPLPQFYHARSPYTGFRVALEAR